MRSNKKSIAIDMDYVIADVETQFINWYERDYGVKILKDNLKGKPEGEAFPDKGAIRKFCFTKGFFSEIPVMAGSQEVVKSLMENFDVFIVSAAMEFPQSLIEKHKWLHENFPFISWRNIIFCGDKSIIGTDYLIDERILIFAEARRSCTQLLIISTSIIIFGYIIGMRFMHFSRQNYQIAKINF
jgi:5'(3')-deoxyribonucleotidase